MYKLILKVIALVSSGLIAGAFFYAYWNMLPTFKEVPTAVHLIFRTTLMKHNGTSMPILMSMAIIATGLLYFIVYKEEPIPRILIILSVLLLFTTLLITLFGNVPINSIIKTWQPDSPPADWTAFLNRWDYYHRLRTITALLGFSCLVIALLISDYVKK